MGDFPSSVRAGHRAPAFSRFGTDATFVYREKNDSTNLGTGAITTDDTDTTIDDVLVGELSSSVIANSGGRYLYGDKIFRIQHDDMPETPPKQTSQCVWGGVIYKIVGHVQSSDSNVWDVIGRKV